MDFEIRKLRTPQGPVRLVREREAYSQLVDQGLSNREACEIVGISVRTGRKWLYGRKPSGKQRKAFLPLGAVEAPSGPSRYLTEADRIHIADRLREKASLREIARELGRSPSTVSREIRRNGTALRGGRSRWVYRPHAAQRRAEHRRRRPKAGKIGRIPELRDFIQIHLTLRWSPEQVSHALRRQFPGRPDMHVVHETIYQALYNRGRGELRRELARSLRTGRAFRRPRKDSHRRRPRAVRDMVLISERPQEAAGRAVPGHWEGDLIVGKGHKSAIGTLVERSSRYLVLVHLPLGHTSGHTRDGLINAIQTFPPQLRRSLAWDQGAEMAMHKAVTTATGVPVYFCNPGSPWQRGSNENTNGLLRQYFPKGTDLSRHGHEELDAVAAALNNRPRKTLGWETPAERLSKLLATTRQ